MRETGPAQATCSPRVCQVRLRKQLPPSFVQQQNDSPAANDPLANVDNDIAFVVNIAAEPHHETVKLVNCPGELVLVGFAAFLGDGRGTVEAPNGGHRQQNHPISSARL